MSRRIASVITGFASLATLPLNKRQRSKTMARVAHILERDGTQEVKTPRGTIKFYSLRGAGTASAVERFGKDEPETIEWIDQYVKPGDTFWDIGANIGLYSLYAGLDPAVKVLAFEPSALNFSLLTEHLALNGLDKNVSPLCVALGNQTKLESLHMSNLETGHASNVIGQAETQFKTFDPVFVQTVPAFTADDFCSIFKLSPPNHIKLDVDSIEDAILQGMPGLLPSVTSIMIEVEGRNAENVATGIEKPLIKAGFAEDMSVRTKGYQRNRLYINKKKAA